MPATLLAPNLTLLVSFGASVLSRLPPGWNRRGAPRALALRGAGPRAAGDSPALLGGATACGAGRLNP